MWGVLFGKEEQIKKMAHAITLLTIHFWTNQLNRPLILDKQNIVYILFGYFSHPVSITTLSVFYSFSCLSFNSLTLLFSIYLHLPTHMTISLSLSPNQKLWKCIYKFTIIVPMETVNCHNFTLELFQCLLLFLFPSSHYPSLISDYFLNIPNKYV